MTPPPTLRSLENTHIKTDTQESEGCGKFGLHKLEKCLRCIIGKVAGVICSISFILRYSDILLAIVVAWEKALESLFERIF